MSDWFWFLVLLELNCCIMMKEAVEGTKSPKSMLPVLFLTLRGDIYSASILALRVLPVKTFSQ